MKAELHRYLFLVRQRFNTEPCVDSFYKLVSPGGMSSDEIKMMTVLKPNWEKESLDADTEVFKGMGLRLRFNADMFQKICLVKSEFEISDEELDMYIKMKYRDGELTEFLNESKI